MKKYEYDGKIYCDWDMSRETGNYGGNTFDLYMALKENGKAGVTIPLYYRKSPESLYYGSVAELIENEFSELEAKE